MRSKLVVVFDLDDTLYPEIDYLKSAYFEIAKDLEAILNKEYTAALLFHEMLVLYKAKKNVFAGILEKYHINNYTIHDLLAMYRNHIPNIVLSNETKNVLTYLKATNIEMCLITDGRSLQQRAKINALGLHEYMQHFVISEEIGTEKPNMANYRWIENKYDSKNTKFVYIGDNVKKDFISPNKLGWISVCLKDKGFNIHSQKVNVPKNYSPHFKIEDIKDVIEVISEIMDVEF